MRRVILLPAGRVPVGPRACVGLPCISRLSSKRFSRTRATSFRNDDESKNEIAQRTTPLLVLRQFRKHVKNVLFFCKHIRV